MSARTGVLLACLVVLPWPAGAQGLGDAAAREKERRAKEAHDKTSRPAYTDDDLPSGKAAAKKGEEPPATSPAPSGSEPAAEPSSSGPLSERAAAEKPYADAVAAAQQRVDALEGRTRELQAMLNPMSSTFIYGGAGGATANDEMRVRNELRDAETQLTAARQALEAAKDALSEFRLGRRPPPPAPPPRK